MLVNNIYSNDKNFRQIQFGARPDIVVKKFALSAVELNKLAELKDSYEVSHKVYTGLNGVYKQKFREIYTGLVNGGKLPGFVFDRKGKRLQVGKLDCTPQAQNEMLSFRVWEKDGENYTHFRINNDGEVIVSKTPDAVLPEIGAGIDKIIKEFKTLEFFSSHFAEVRKFLRQHQGDFKLEKILKSLNQLDNSNGIKSKIKKVNNTYKRVSSILTGKNIREALQRKRQFLGYEVSPKTKGLIFKNFGKNGEAYGFCPIFSEKDDRLFKLTVWDKDDNIQDVFVFFESGNVAKLKRNIADSKRGHSFIAVSDAEIKKEGLNKIIKSLTEKLEEFEEFLIKDEQAKEAAAKTRKPKSAPVVEPAKVQEPEVKQIEQLKPPAPVKRIPTYEELTLNSIVDNLAKIFKTPIEERSSHLIHERLSNGNLFNGRFSMKASDGAEVIVTRMKSPKYVDFLYYSIKVNNKNGGFVLNLDPDFMKILESTKDGKPVIDKRNMVRHISKNEFLAQNPEAINLPKYLSEIFEVRNDTERKIVKSNAKQRSVKEIIRKQEEEIQELLSHDGDFGDFD